MSIRRNSHDLPGQGIGPVLPTQHLCSNLKRSFIPKNHETREFEFVIPHKQNPHTEVNQLSVTARYFRSLVYISVWYL
jgi:hypothetical protein